MDGVWVGDPCLGDDERARFRHVDERPRGKVDVPREGK
jgi:hypothetical protein